MQRKIKNILSSYTLYKKLHSNIVDSKKYVVINNMFNKFLINKVLEGQEITLPNRFGTLSIIGRKQKIILDENGKPKGLAPDWVKTKLLWDNNPKAKEEKKLLFHINAHTDNIIYRYLWSKKQMLVENKILYALKLTRANKRAVHKLIKEGKQYITKYL